MKINQIAYTAILIITIIVCWQVYDWTHPNYQKLFRENSEEFASNRPEFENLIKVIKLEYLVKNQKSNLAELSKIVSKKYDEKLGELGIESLEISYNEEANCSEKFCFQFNAECGYNARKLNDVQIIYSPCNHQTRKGFHENLGHVDINGEGNNWLIYSNTNLI